MSFCQSAQHVKPPSYRNIQTAWEGWDWQTTLQHLEGTWVNVESPFEQYTVQGHHVTRKDSRGIQHFTLQWDYEGQRWQWGTHGRLALEWFDENSISWVPDVHAINPKVWNWRRSWQSTSTPPDFTPFTAPESTYGPDRRHRSSHQHWSQPYPYSVPPPPPPPPAMPYQDGSWDTWDEGSCNGCDCDYFDEPRFRRQPRNCSSYGHSWRQKGYRFGGFRYRGNEQLECGLTARQVNDLMSRDITPEDYEMLLGLDKLVPKQTASSECIDALPTITKEEFMGNECSVCLSSFEAHDEVAALPCKHFFHRTCVTKWLAECRRMCPLCGAEVLKPDEAEKKSDWY